MSLVQDRDLLVIEPGMFTTATGAGTVLAEGTDGALSGVVFSSGAARFDDAGLDEGHVAVVGAETVEVTGNVLATQCDVSRPRAVPDDPPIEPTSGSGLTYSVVTFARLIAREEAGLLQRIERSLDVEESPAIGDIVNEDAARVAVAMQVVARAFAQAAASDPADDTLAERATLYLGQARGVMQMTVIELDMDGDGFAETQIPLDRISLRRV